MVRPKAYKLKCSKCGYQKIIHPKSDVVNFTEILSVCEKCNMLMKKEDLNLFEKLFYNNFR